MLFYRWDDDILSSVYDLGQYWAALSMEEKWLLTEMSATDLYQLMKHDQHWEILRTASESVSYFAHIYSVIDFTVNTNVLWCLLFICLYLFVIINFIKLHTVF